LGIEECDVALKNPNPLALGRRLPGAAELLLRPSLPALIVGSGESMVVAKPTDGPPFDVVAATGVPPLTAGVTMAGVWAEVLANPVDIIALISLSCSKMSLSPASSLIPGSRYTHSALSSEHSLHFGLAPSQRDFRERHISHCGWHKLRSLGCIVLAGNVVQLSGRS
jgi:hypothetical protein